MKGIEAQAANDTMYRGLELQLHPLINFCGRRRLANQFTWELLAWQGLQELPVQA